MIELKNVSKAYVKDKKVVENINLKIEDGIIFGFIGPNGAGKTTTMEMLTGILDIDEGEILIDGINIEKEPIKAKKEFGFVPDSPDAFEKLTGVKPRTVAYMFANNSEYGVGARNSTDD